MDNFVININDFPQDRTVLFLKEDYRLRLFNKSMEIFGSNKEFLKFFNRKNYNFIETWKNGKITRNSKWITKQGIVLNHIFKLSDYLINKGYNNYRKRNCKSLIDLGLIKFDKIGEYNSLVYNITNEGKEYLKKLLNMNMLNKDIRKSLKEELDER